MLIIILKKIIYESLQIIKAAIFGFRFEKGFLGIPVVCF
jgi:hypothetical protein